MAAVRLPVPEPGVVIRYSYLWHSEHAAKREEGVKDRPCAVVLVREERRGERWVTVLPVTHVAPKDAAAAIEIPTEVKRRLRLDDDRSWIVLTEANQFKWPGPDLRPTPGKGVMYGPLPPAFFQIVLERFVAAVVARKARTVPRTE